MKTKADHALTACNLAAKYPWHKTAWHAWQEASWTSKLAIPASRGIWNMLRTYLRQRNGVDSCVGHDLPLSAWVMPTASGKASSGPEMGTGHARIISLLYPEEYLAAMAIHSGNLVMDRAVISGIYLRQCQQLYCDIVPISHIFHVWRHKDGITRGFTQHRF